MAAAQVSIPTQSTQPDWFPDMYAILPTMTFSQAMQNLLDSLTAPVPHARARYRSKNTLKDYQRKKLALDAFFGKYRLNEIHLGHFRQYQEERSTNADLPAGPLRCRKGGRAHGPFADEAEALKWIAAHGGGYELFRARWAHPTGAAKVNAELCMLERVMRYAGCWTPELERNYERFQVDESEIPRALTIEDQQRFLEVASTRPEWKVVYCYSLVALHTGFSTDELRAIRQGDINLTYGILAVNRKVGKNKYRRREISLTDPECLWALEQLLERSYTMGGRGPQKYLFPARTKRNEFDNERPMSETGLRRPFEQVRYAARLEWFELNGWRHTAATRWAEAGVPQAIRQQRMGHTSPKMTEHYEHIMLGAERQIMMNAGSRKPAVSIDSIRMRRELAGY